MEWPVKAGRKMTIEIEFLEDMDIYERRHALLNSLYGTTGDNPFKDQGFKVTMIYGRSSKEFMDELKSKLTEYVNQMKL